MIEHLSKNELSALSDLAVIGHSMAVPLMLVGANARRLTFDIPLHLTSPRTTQDWDFAAPMEHWEIFVRFYGQTVGSEGARFRAGDSAHRIIHKETGILLDLVPFGPLSDLDGNIRWPQSNEVMSVLGFQEAYESCIHEKLPNGIEILSPAFNSQWNGRLRLHLTASAHSFFPNQNAVEGA